MRTGSNDRYTWMHLASEHYYLVKELVRGIEDDIATTNGERYICRNLIEKIDDLEKKTIEFYRTANYERLAKGQKA